MNALLQVVLALVAWFFVAISPAARLGYEDRHLPEGKRRSVAIMPAWPLMPLLFLAPAAIFGFQHVVMKVIAALHGVFLLWTLGYISYWIVRRRRDI